VFFLVTGVIFLAAFFLFLILPLWAELLRGIKMHIISATENKFFMRIKVWVILAKILNI
jgi:hypothetical protein